MVKANKRYQTYQARVPSEPGGLVDAAQTKINSVQQDSPVPRQSIQASSNLKTWPPPGLPVPKSPIVFGDLTDENTEEPLLLNIKDANSPPQASPSESSNPAAKASPPNALPDNPASLLFHSPLWIDTKRKTLDEAYFGRPGELPDWMKSKTPRKIIPLDELSKRTKSEWKNHGMWPKKEDCLPGIKWDDKLDMPSGFENPKAAREGRKWWDVAVAMASNVDEGIDNMSETTEQLHHRGVHMEAQQAAQKLREHLAQLKEQQDGAKHTQQDLQSELSEGFAEVRADGC
jgi:hypothetical protein